LWKDTALGAAIFALRKAHLTRRRGVFKSVADLEHAIAAYVREHSKTAKPFLWTKPTDAILAKLRRLPIPSE
jgi:hypothetical protein